MNNRNNDISPNEMIARMPMLQKLHHFFTDAYGENLNKIPHSRSTLFVIVQHGFLNTTPIFDILFRFGIRKDQILVSTKPQTTSTKMRNYLNRTFGDRHVPFDSNSEVGCLNQFAGDRYDAVNHNAFEILLNRLKHYLTHPSEGRRFSNVVVCDEGGRFVSKLYQNNFFREYAREFNIAVIEHTNCGTRGGHLRDMDYLYINMAKSFAKLKVESLLIARAVFRELEARLDDLIIEGHTQLAVLGLGYIGKDILSLLVNKCKNTPGIKILLYDKECTQYLWVEEQVRTNNADGRWNKVILPNTSDKSDIVSYFEQSIQGRASIYFGCSGNNPFKTIRPRQILNKILVTNSDVQETVLFSCSSGQREFKIVNDEIMKALSDNPQIIDNAIVYRDSHTNRIISIENCGFPVNFSLERESSLTPEEAQLTNSIKLVAIIQALNMLQIMPFLRAHVEGDDWFKKFTKLYYQEEIVDWFLHSITRDPNFANIVEEIRNRRDAAVHSNSFDIDRSVTMPTFSDIRAGFFSYLNGETLRGGDIPNVYKFPHSDSNLAKAVYKIMQRNNVLLCNREHELENFTLRKCHVDSREVKSTDSAVQDFLADESSRTLLFYGDPVSGKTLSILYGLKQLFDHHILNQSGTRWLPVYINNDGNLSHTNHHFLKSFLVNNFRLTEDECQALIEPNLFRYKLLIIFDGFDRLNFSDDNGPSFSWYFSYSMTTRGAEWLDSNVKFVMIAGSDYLSENRIKHLKNIELVLNNGNNSFRSRVQRLISLDVIDVRQVVRNYLARNKHICTLSAKTCLSLIGMYETLKHLATNPHTLNLLLDIFSEHQDNIQSACLYTILESLSKKLFASEDMRADLQERSIISYQDFLNQTNLDHEKIFQRFNAHIESCCTEIRLSEESYRFFSTYLFEYFVVKHLIDNSMSLDEINNNRYVINSSMIAMFNEVWTKPGMENAYLDCVSSLLKKYDANQFNNLVQQSIVNLLQWFGVTLTTAQDSNTYIAYIPHHYWSFLQNNAIESHPSIKSLMDCEEMTNFQMSYENMGGYIQRLYSRKFHATGRVHPFPQAVSPLGTAVKKVLVRLDRYLSIRDRLLRSYLPEELSINAINNFLFDNDGSMLSLDGPPGIGKTQLINSYINNRLNKQILGINAVFFLPVIINFYQYSSQDFKGIVRSVITKELELSKDEIFQLFCRDNKFDYYPLIIFEGLDKFNLTNVEVIKNQFFNCIESIINRKIIKFDRTKFIVTRQYNVWGNQLDQYGNLRNEGLVHFSMPPFSQPNIKEYIARQLRSRLPENQANPKNFESLLNQFSIFKDIQGNPRLLSAFVKFLGRPTDDLDDFDYTMFSIFERIIFYWFEDECVRLKTRGVNSEDLSDWPSFIAKVTNLTCQLYSSIFTNDILNQYIYSDQRDRLRLHGPFPEETMVCLLAYTSIFHYFIVKCILSYASSADESERVEGLLFFLRLEDNSTNSRLLRESGVFNLLGEKLLHPRNEKKLNTLRKTLFDIVTNPEFDRNSNVDIASAIAILRCLNITRFNDMDLSNKHLNSANFYNAELTNLNLTNASIENVFIGGESGLLTDSKCRCVAYHPSLKLLAIGHDDGVIKLFDTVNYCWYKTELSGKHSRHVQSISYMSSEDIKVLSTAPVYFQFSLCLRLFIMAAWASMVTVYSGFDHEVFLGCVILALTLTFFRWAYEVEFMYLWLAIGIGFHDEIIIHNINDKSQSSNYKKFVWDYLDSSLRYECNSEAYKAKSLGVSSGGWYARITAVTHSPCGNYLALGFSNGFIGQWDIEFNQWTKEIMDINGSPVDIVTSLSYSPCGKYLVADYMRNTLRHFYIDCEVGECWPEEGECWPEEGLSDLRQRKSIGFLELLCVLLDVLLINKETHITFTDEKTLYQNGSDLFVVDNFELSSNMLHELFSGHEADDVDSAALKLDSVSDGLKCLYKHSDFFQWNCDYFLKKDWHKKINYLACDNESNAFICSYDDKAIYYSTIILDGEQNNRETCLKAVGLQLRGVLGLTPQQYVMLALAGSEEAKNKILELASEAESNQSSPSLNHVKETLFCRGIEFKNTEGERPAFSN